MAAKPMRQTSPKKKPAAASETSESIAAQVEQFLKAGKKIDIVDSGISGKPTLGASNAANPRRAS